MLLACSVMSSQAQIDLQINNVTGQSIQFNGSSHSFQLNPTSGGDQFHITGVNNGVSPADDTAVELLAGGYITSGPWSYGGITTSGTTESANVTGGGTLTIPDGLGHNLTGTVNWITVQTSSGIGGVNADLDINVTDLTYSGSLLDLKQLVDTSLGTMNLSFEFNPGKTLDLLSMGAAPYNNSYAGDIVSAVPEPTTIMSAALLLLPFGASGLRILRKNRAV